MPQQNIINIGPSQSLPVSPGFNPTSVFGIGGTVPITSAPIFSLSSTLPDPYIVNITTTNMTQQSAEEKLKRQAGRAAASFLHVPSVISDPLLNTLGSGKDSVYRQYTSLPLVSLNKLPGIQIQDFRSRISPIIGIESNSVTFDGENANSYLNQRLDGASAVLRGSGRAALYSAATIAPGGAYTIFNRNAPGKLGYGMGDPGDPHALRNDFTARSQVATRWKKEKKFKFGKNKGKTKKVGKFIATINPIEKATPFRGDKVNVIDFGQRRLNHAYQWRPDAFVPGSGFGELLGRSMRKAGRTNDFIKFLITGPKITANEFKKPHHTDDIFAFRCTDLSVSDNFNAAYSQVNMIGRADPNYHYGGYTRDVSIGFTVHATDRDELKPIWRKLNFLASYTAPEYNPTQLGLTAPWMRITVGDLFVQQPALISSLGYELAGTDTSWEINIEGDPTNMQVPHSVKVSMTLYMITDYLPQKGGNMYTLAKSFNKDGLPEPGKDNWLSDAMSVAEKPTLETDKDGKNKPNTLESDKDSKRRSDALKTDKDGDPTNENTLKSDQEGKGNTYTQNIKQQTPIKEVNDVAGVQIDADKIS